MMITKLPDENSRKKLFDELDGLSCLPLKSKQTCHTFEGPWVWPQNGAPVDHRIDHA